MRGLSDYDSSNSEDFSEFAQIVFGDGEKSQIEEIEEPIAHRTRSRVKIPESIDNLLEIHGPNIPPGRNRVWTDFLSSLDDNATNIYDNPHDSFTPAEELGDEPDNFSFPSISQRELSYLSQVEESPQESSNSGDRETEDLLPGQVELLIVQMSKVRDHLVLFVQLAVQICMISTVSENTDLLGVVAQCRRMLAQFEEVIPKESSLLPLNLGPAIEMLEESRLFHICTSRYDQFLAMEIVKFCKNRNRFYESSCDRLTLNHMDLLVSRRDVFVFPHLFFWRYPRNSAKRKTYARFSYDEINLLAIGIVNHKRDYRSISDNYLTYMAPSFLAKTTYRLRNAKSYGIDFNSVKYLKQYKVLPCFTTSCQLYSMTLPTPEHLWDSEYKPDWLDTFLAIALVIHDFQIMTSLPFNFLTLNLHLELPPHDLAGLREKRKRVDLSYILGEIRAKIHSPPPSFERFI